jgi:hypothetical protein
VAYVPRETIEEVEVSGVVLPKGTVVQLCPAVINLSPSVWGPDAEAFNPDRWDIGEQYPKPGDPQHATPGEVNPGPWPKRPTWDLSLQLLIWAGFNGLSVQQKVGNCGSENALAGHVRLGRLFGIYWNTGDLARGVQRRLNPTGYESKGLDQWVGPRRIPRDRWGDPGAG